MHVVESGLIFQGTESDRNNNVSFCGLTVLPNGTLLAGARLASAKDSPDGNIGIWISNDAGKTWFGPNLPFQTEWEEKRGCLRAGNITPITDEHWMMALLWVDRRVTGRPMYNSATGGLCEMFPVLSETHDAGKSWTPLRRLAPSPGQLPTALCGPILQLEDGTLACPLEIQKEYDDPGPIFNHSVLLLSHDGGNTWPERVLVAGEPLEDRVYWDQRIAMLGNGNLINTFWTYHTKQEHDMNVHVSFSHDNARTWSRPVDTGIIGQIAEPVVIHSRHIILLYVRRDREQRLMARESHDSGHSWDRDSEICFYEHLAGKGHSSNLFNAMSEWSFGHPKGIKLSENELFAVFYAGEGQNTGLHYCRIRING